MAWVTWRQHRLQLLGVSLMVLLVAVAAAITAQPIRSAYHGQALAACLPPAAQPGCDLILSHFSSEFGSRVQAARFLVILPALVGVLIGAPLLAREFEQGTFRLAWAQGISRRRWLLAKTLWLGLAVVLASVALALIAMWWRQPFDRVAGRMSPSGFDIEGLVVPAYGLFALTVGIFAGLLLRRSLAALALAGGIFVATRGCLELLLRPHYLPPLHRTASGLVAATRARDWIIDNTVVDAVGRRITSAREGEAVLHAQRAGIQAQQYLASVGWRRVITFQPADRFWTFQGIEAGILLVLAALAVLGSVALLRRRPA